MRSVSKGPTYRGDAIRGIPSVNSLLGSSYFNPSVHSPEMPQRNFGQEKSMMRGLVNNEVVMQRKLQPKLIDVEGQNALKRLQSESAIAADARPILDAERRAMGLDTADAAVRRSLMDLGPSRIESELERQAYQGLMDGRTLSAQENRDAIQGARAGLSARGLATGNSAVVAEVMNRDQFARGRERERQGFAASVEGMQRGRMAGDLEMARAGAGYLNSQLNPRTQVFGAGDMLSKNRSQPLTLFNQTGPYVADFANNNLQAATAYNGQMINRDMGLAQMQHDIGMTLMNARFFNDIGTANMNAANAAGRQAIMGQMGGALLQGIGSLMGGGGGGGMLGGIFGGGGGGAAAGAGGGLLSGIGGALGGVGSAAVGAGGAILGGIGGVASGVGGAAIGAIGAIF